jgi:ribosomal protein S18 acetylase RimI-like enzyme
MSFAGFEAEARALLPFIDPDLAMLIEVEGRPVAMGLALPDLNEALSGVTSPRSLIGRIRVGWRLRNLQTVSFKLIGVDPEFRRMGLESLLITEILRRGVEKGFERCDLSLVRELNQAMRRLIERLGARRYLSYRTFERPIRP